MSATTHAVKKPRLWKSDARRERYSETVNRPGQRAVIHLVADFIGEKGREICWHGYVEDGRDIRADVLREFQRLLDAI